MGRPCRCCGCEPPVVNCYIDNGYFYYTITNAESATLDGDAITLFENGSASGSIPMDSGDVHTVVARNRCGVTTCEKNCYTILCYSIYKLGDEAHICDGTSRKDTVTLEIFVSILDLSGVEIDLNIAKFYVNSHLVSMEEDTRQLPCSLGSTSGTGYFGTLTIDRCSLEDAYYLFVDITGECGPPAIDTYTSPYYITCQNPWFPTFLEKQNTGIVEIDMGDGFSYSRTTVDETSSSIYGWYTTTLEYDISGLSAFSGTYLLPIQCDLDDRMPCNYDGDGQDQHDEKYITYPESTNDLGTVTTISTTDTIRPYGNGSSTSYERDITIITKTNTARLIISSDHGVASIYMSLIVQSVRTQTFRTMHYATSSGTQVYQLNTDKTCTLTSEPYSVCPANSNKVIRATCVTSHIYTRDGVVYSSGTSNSNMCDLDSSFTNGAAGVYFCASSNGVYTLSGIGAIPGGSVVLSPSNETSTFYVCYSAGSWNCNRGDTECMSTTVTLLGEISSYYDCL
jgi:hypothetical protein